MMKQITETLKITNFKNNILKIFHKRILIFCFYTLVSLFLCTTLAMSQTTTESVEYNFKRGFYTNSFQLELSCKTQGSNIRYTLDGSKPTLSKGQNYSGPLQISSNSMVRAYAFVSHLEDSKVKTHTYIFPEQVIRQKNNMLEDYGYDYSSEETGKVFWTEEMDPEIVDAEEYKNEIIQGLLDIPTLSVVMPKEDLWGENGIHWGDNLEEDGDDFERECSIEMINPKGNNEDTRKSWQENCGIKIQGGGGRWWKGASNHKQSFTLVFKNIYGAGKLKNEIFADAPHGKESTAGKYDKIILRSGTNKGWGSTWDREKTVYTRDQLGRDLQILMSDFGSHGTFLHLYLNGKYWGLYNPCERPDNNFLANNLGGESEDYFYAKGKESTASDDRDGEPGQSKSRFYEANSKDYSEMPFSEMRNWVMVDESIASFLVYGYANPGDGPQYYYGNNNNPSGPVVWIPWDIEDSFGGGSKRTGSPNVENMIDHMEIGDNGFNAFWTNIDFRMRFNDLVYKHFYNDGVMTDDNVTAAWDNLTNYIYKPIICESARWGDERSSKPMERDKEWDVARLAVRNDFKGRGNDFISKLQTEGYFSTLSVPKYSIADTEIETSILHIIADSSVMISKEPDDGEIYYTLDGSDPRTWDLKGSVSANAIAVKGNSTVVTIMEDVTIKARTKKEDKWSPLHELVLIADRIVTTEILKIDEALTLYPNPVSEKLYWSTEKEYAVYSTLGTLMMKGKGTEIFMNGLPDGLYLIRIDNRSYKILKQ